MNIFGFTFGKTTCSAAGKLGSQIRIANERSRVFAVANQMRRERGLGPHPALQDRAFVNRLWANALRAPRSHASHSKPAAFRPSGFDRISQGARDA